MVQSTDLSDGHHSPQVLRLYRPLIGCILAQAEMSAALVIIGKIGRENSPQRAFVEHDHMVQALPPYGTNYAFDVGSLRRILASYFFYYHETRPHLSLEKDSPESRSAQPPEAGRVVAVSQVGGLHNRYERRAA